jgi:predicted DNA-binding protein (UPF0251 family)
MISVSAFASEQGIEQLLVQEALTIHPIAFRQCGGKGTKIYDYDDLLFVIDTVHLPYTWLSKSKLIRQLHISDKPFDLLTERMPDLPRHRFGIATFFNPDDVSRIAHEKVVYYHELEASRKAVNAAHRRAPAPPKERKKRTYDIPANPSLLTRIKAQGYMSANECAAHLEISPKIFRNLLLEIHLEADQYIAGLGRFFKLSSLAAIVDYVEGYSVKDAAKECGMSVTTFRRHIKETCKLGERIYVSREQLKKFKEALHERVSV